MVAWKVMGLNELDSIPSEEEVDREDSGEDFYLGHQCFLILRLETYVRK